VSARTFRTMSPRDPDRCSGPIDVAAPVAARFPATNPIPPMIRISSGHDNGRRRLTTSVPSPVPPAARKWQQLNAKRYGISRKFGYVEPEKQEMPPEVRAPASRIACAPAPNRLFPPRARIARDLPPRPHD